MFLIYNVRFFQISIKLLYRSFPFLLEKFYCRFLGEDMQAKLLAEKVRVLCWVMTAPDNHDLKAKHVKATWGKRCNILLFMSTEEGKQI